eukprot:scaffold20000_cov86-Skeletonema_dohrnii-CCMP3373.AAC.1
MARLMLTLSLTLDDFDDVEEVGSCHWYVLNPIGDDEYMHQPNPQEQTPNTRPTSSQINVSAEEYLL